MKRICVFLAALALLALTACAARQPAAPTGAEQVQALRFRTTDREGNAVDESVLRGQRLVMLNC